MISSASSCSAHAAKIFATSASAARSWRVGATSASYYRRGFGASIRRRTRSGRWRREWNCNPTFSTYCGATRRTTSCRGGGVYRHAVPLTGCKSRRRLAAEWHARSRCGLRVPREAIMARRNSPDSGRRNFLKGATMAGAAALTAPARAASVPSAAAPRAKAAPPGPRLAAAETMPPIKDPVTQTTSGGDFMVDVFKTLDIDYLAMNCASSFRGLHEAVLNHGGNTKPEILTCPHEEIAVHMAQGYGKIEGKPMAMICHGVFGRHHASMAVSAASCNRALSLHIACHLLAVHDMAPGQHRLHLPIDPAA